MAEKQFVVMLMYDPNGNCTTPSFCRNGDEDYVFTTYKAAADRKAALKTKHPQCWYSIAVLSIGKDDDRR